VMSCITFVCILFLFLPLSSVSCLAPPEPAQLHQSWTLDPLWPAYSGLNQGAVPSALPSGRLMADAKRGKVLQLTRRAPQEISFLLLSATQCCLLPWLRLMLVPNQSQPISRILVANCEYTFLVLLQILDRWSRGRCFRFVGGPAPPVAAAHFRAHHPDASASYLSVSFAGVALQLLGLPLTCSGAGLLKVTPCRNHARCCLHRHPVHSSVTTWFRAEIGFISFQAPFG
jgi:hypothetical protein